MHAPRRSGFSLAELLIVIAIIAILAALIGLSVSNVFELSNTTKCISNLHYLSQAVAMRRSDTLESQRLPMKVTHWATEWGVLPYIDYNRDVLICPGTGSSENTVNQEEINLEWDLDTLADWGIDEETQNILEDESFETTDIVELVEVKVVAGHGTYYIPFETGPYCVKLSLSQYARARGQGLLGNSDASNNFHDKWSEGYQKDGDGNEYWLCFEDYGGDWDFKDIMVKVKDNGDGTYNLSLNSGHTGHTNSIVTSDEHEFLAAVPKDTVDSQLSIGEVEDMPENYSGGYESHANPYDVTQTSDEQSGIFVTSYAINGQPAVVKKNGRYVPDKPGKVLLMDYYKPVATTDDVWASHDLDPNQDGVPLFARHAQRINVLYTDGAVRSVHPDEINPAVPTNEILYWSP